jgi:methionyl-tRNA formyltransferase
MDHGIDTGDILFQEKISLEGTLDSIFERIISSGTYGIKFIISNIDNLEFLAKKQYECDATFFNRRTPEQSEITLEELQNNDANFLHNKIRCLADPYPNAYIKCKDGQKLYILKSRIDYEK